MNKYFFIVSAAFVAVIAVTLSAGGYGGKYNKGKSSDMHQKGYKSEMKMHMSQNDEKNIAEIAISANNLSTLVQALKAADLVEVIQGPGPFTVFAPTNEAFAELGPKLNELLKPENKEQLKQILLFHVVPGKVMSADIKDMNAKTASGETVEIRLMNGKVKVGDAIVTQPDINASNGVVHVIDKVILPEN